MLGPTAVVVLPGAVDRLVDSLTEMGYLTDVDLSDL
jgi:hypothetical protein